MKEVPPHALPFSQEDARWVLDTYGSHVLAGCIAIVQQNPNLLEICDIAEIASAVVRHGSNNISVRRPELRYDPETSSRPLIPRQNLIERIRGLFG